MSTTAPASCYFTSYAAHDLLLAMSHGPPMLPEDEWALVSPHLTDMITQIQTYRSEPGCSLEAALRDGAGREALALYESLAAFRETNVTRDLS